MGKLTNDKKINLLKIKRERLFLGIDLENGLIKENDILSLLKVDSEYGYIKRQGRLYYKESVLKQIYNCPFLLCDQELLSKKVKSIIPIFLNTRYDMELDELDILVETGQISYDEYLNLKEMLKFCYYESSNEGKEILKKGHIRSFVKVKK